MYVTTKRAVCPPPPILKLFYLKRYEDEILYTCCSHTDKSSNNILEQLKGRPLPSFIFKGVGGEGLNVREVDDRGGV